MDLDNQPTLFTSENPDCESLLQPGELFGQYRIKSLLGRGGMGEVYEAEQEVLGRRFALKLIRSSNLAGEDGTQKNTLVIRSGFAQNCLIRHATPAPIPAHVLHPWRIHRLTFAKENNMMNITRKKQAADDPHFESWHKLVVAEAGFSMLDIYGRHKHGLNIDVIREFADTVNRRNEAGSLHPKAPISALPRRYFREIKESDIPNHIDEFRRDFSEFINENRQTIKAKQVLIDLHVSPQPVAEEYLSAIEEILRSQQDDAGIDEVVIFE